VGSRRQTQAGMGGFTAAKAPAAQPLFGAIGWQPDLCKNGGECVGFQSRKAARTCSSLFLSDDTGTLLACSGPVAGNHHDLFEIERVFGELAGLHQEAGLEEEDLFLNADAGFDSERFRKLCSALKIEANIASNPRNGIVAEGYVYFDEQLYK
jgi:hypothetical protein